MEGSQGHVGPLNLTARAWTKGAEGPLDGAAWPPQATEGAAAV